MNMQTLLVRGGVMFAMGFGLTIATIYNEPVIGSVAPVATASKPIVAKISPREAAPTVLPTVSVRPSAAEMALAMSSDESEESDNTQTFIDAVKEKRSVDPAVSLRSLHLDMPYYSFGKTLPRVGKE